ncbi:HAD-like domain-containing protein, partial [Blastocladiella britannica]
MASVPPLGAPYLRRPTVPLLPPIIQGRTHTLVLDLDETLLHCSTTPMQNASLAFSVDFNGTRFDIYGNLRPGVHRFLRKVAQVYEVVIFTASQQVYAERVLQALDPSATLIAHVLHRDHCVPVLGNYLKDLSSLGRDLRRTLIVDNAPQAFSYHPANGLPIRSWYDDPSDRAL